MDHFVWGEVSRELSCGSKKGIEIISYQEYISMIIDSYDVGRAQGKKNCDCQDSDADGVPDAWDQCPNTPAGSCTNNHGCLCEGLYTEEQMNQMVSNILTWGDTNNDGKIGLAEAIQALRITSGVTLP